MTYLPSIEIEPKNPATATIIWLHGLGADGNDFVPLIPYLQLTTVRFIFPNAPSIPVTINNGYVMPAWYDILELSLERKVDQKQLCASATEITRLIDREITRGIDSRRIIIAGFSQGGAVAYQAALSYSKPLGGLLALSTYFATASTIQYHDANRQIPILIQHGTSDPVVPESLGKNAFKLLKERNYPAEYQSYSMDHTLCPEQIEAIAAWIKVQLSSTD